MPDFSKTRDMVLSPIKEMELRAAKLGGVVSLAQGIPSFRTPEPIERRVKEAIDLGLVSKYSLAPGLPELREMIAQDLLGEGIEVDFETEMIVTVGAMGGLAAALLTILEPGDEVIIPSPVYASYPNLVQVAGGVPVWAPLDEEAGWALDLDVIREKVSDRTRAIFFCNPNNPTGTIYSREQLGELLEMAREHDFYILTDEVYKDFLFAEDEYVSLAEDREALDRVIRVTSFSKAYAMTGWRVGYVVSSAENIREILKVSDTLVTCAPVVSQYAAMGAIEFGRPYREEFREEFRRRRDVILEELSTMSELFSVQTPTSSYFVFPRIEKYPDGVRDSKEFCVKLLEEARVALVPGVAFGPSGEDHVRLSFSRDVEDIRESFERMREW